MYNFSRKVAFVTGGSSGIGLATARAFARAGAHVVIASRSEEAGREACITLKENGGPSGLYIRMDVRDEASVARAIVSTVQHFGRLDFAFNAAGIGGDMAPLKNSSQDIWDDVMAVNARGVWLAMRYEIGAMLKFGGQGAIVNMSSIYGVAGKPAHHAYVASKHAVIGMTRSVALEYATRGIRVERTVRRCDCYVWHARRGSSYSRNRKRPGGTASHGTDGERNGNREHSFVALL